MTFANLFSAKKNAIFVFLLIFSKLHGFGRPKFLNNVF